VKPLKESATDDQKIKHQEDEEKKVGKATRHIIMIRHGQYFDQEKLDEGRKLTDLGVCLGIENKCINVFI